ncbi:MAG: hypothetical protein ABIW79_10490, partial [Gemmatimonas sp.]
RIVSALDDVPGGVIPNDISNRVSNRGSDRAPRRSPNPSWWRRAGIAAAALLFVASGSVLVSRNGNETALWSDSASSAIARGPSATPSAAPAPAASTESSLPHVANGVAEFRQSIRGTATDVAAAGAASAQDMVAQGTNVQAEASGVAGASAVRDERLARRDGAVLNAPRLEPSRREAAMSAPASNPVAAAPPVVTSPVIAASPNVPPRGLGAVTLAEARTVDSVAGNQAAAAGRAASADISAKATAQGAAKTAASPPANARALRAAEQSVATASAPAPPASSLDAAQRLSATSLLGCYAINASSSERGAARRATADASAHLPVPSRFRLSDTVAASGAPWLLARVLGGAPTSTELQWRPVPSDTVELRVLAAAGTSVVRVGVGGGAQRIPCR